MALPIGTQLGPYSILGRLGEGGMGEVYRARDTRLGREVAVKVLPSSVADDPERLRRFEHEARAAGILSHPALLAVFDVGTHDGAPYIVTELLDGDTLRTHLAAGPVALRTAIDWAAQIARGLAAAHEKGIVHRDLKPDNVVVTRDGRVKIVDFGLAKLMKPLAMDEASTGALGTIPGVVLGTVGYLAPEQVRGLPVDHRSDVFSFGAVLHEMLCGRRAFLADTPVETMAAILRDPTPSLPETIPSAVAAVVARCLEKDPARRYQSATDVAFDLEAIALSSSTRTRPLPFAVVAGRRRRLALGAAAVAALALTVAVTRVAWPVASPPVYRPLTFRRGFVSAARFAPDGQTVYYSAAWQGEPPEIFSTRLDSPESRSLGLKPAELLSVSRSGELAVLLDVRTRSLYRRTGTLARLPFGATAPRAVLEDVEWADWSPDGESLAIVRTVDGACRLEYPIGRVLYTSKGWLSHPRVSPGGDAVAILDHPGANDDDSGSVVVVAGEKATTLAKGWVSLQGVVWSGSEIWFAGARRGSGRAAHAVSTAGVERELAQAPGTFTVADRLPSRGTLILHGTETGGMIALAPGEPAERDLSWFDWSVLTDLSTDGRNILFHEAGNAGSYATYLRSTSGGPAIRLAEGRASALSPDGKWACITAAAGTRLRLVPTGVGEARELVLGALQCDMGRWFPDGRRLLLACDVAGEGQRFFIHDPFSGSTRPLTKAGFRLPPSPISPDGRLVAAEGGDRGLHVFVVDTGAESPVPGCQPGDQPAGWSADAKTIFVYRNDRLPVEIRRIELATGRVEPWKRLLPPDASGVRHIGTVLVNSDMRSYAYSYQRFLSDLYIVDGL